MNKGNRIFLYVLKVENWVEYFKMALVYVMIV